MCAVTICAALTQCELSIPPSWMSPNPQSFPNSPRISAPGLLSPNFGICVFLYNTIYFPVSNSIPLLQVHFTQCTQTKLEDALENQNCTKQSCAWFCSASFQRLAYSTDPLLPKARLGFITHSSVVRLLFVRKAVHGLLRIIKGLLWMVCPCPCAYWWGQFLTRLSPWGVQLELLQTIVISTQATDLLSQVFKPIRNGSKFFQPFFFSPYSLMKTTQWFFHFCLIVNRENFCVYLFTYFYLFCSLSILFFSVFPMNLKVF